MKQFRLIDKNGYVESYFVPDEHDKDYAHALSGKLFSVVAWTLDDLPSEAELIAILSIKWDGCSHWNFYGEDHIQHCYYDDKVCEEISDEKQSYYHICGIKDYLALTRAMVFAYKLMTDKVKRYLEKDEFNLLEKLHLLDGYEILEIDINHVDK